MTEKNTTTLVLEGPAYYTAFTLPQEKGDDLVFNREGTEVASSDAKSIIDVAEKHGVVLTEKKK